MPRKATSRLLETATARARLPVRKRPFWQRLGPGLSLGYRRCLGPGSWSVRASDHAGGEWLKRIGAADDHEPADGRRVLDYTQAVDEARKLVRQGDDTEDLDSAKPLSLDQALHLYKRTLAERGANPRNADRPRHHLSARVLSMPCKLISESELRSLRTRMLEGGNAPASVNRTMNAVRAALTIACPNLTQRWRTALKALPDATEANNVVIDDPNKVRQFVQEAYRHSEQLGLLMHALAETGARPGQIVRVLVRDLIDKTAAPRLMVPRSGKGGTRHPQQRKLERFAVSISVELAVKLRAAAKGRPSNAALFVQADGSAWNADPAQDYRRDVREIMARIDLDPDIYTVYCLRHTSITRMLLAGVHTGIAAKCHDTSEAMIRRHYSASILDFTDEITRKTLPAFGPMEPAHAGNVVALKR